jgi:hypothetical protein
MSLSSGRPPARVRLAVTADPGTEISLIDHAFQVCGHGIGTLDTELVPGLYKLRYQTGLTIRETYQAVEPDGEMVRVSAPSAVYSSAAPLPGTADNNPYHQAAGELSRKVHATLGGGSQVFVFARARGGLAGFARITGRNPAAGLSLHNRDGARLVNLSKVAKRAGATGRWAGCTVAVPPGEYRLRQRLRPAEAQQYHLEQTIVASRGWQTQIFLTQSPSELAEDGQPGGLAPAHTSVLQARIDHGFDAQPDAARLADLARIGLTNGRAIIPLSELPGMLSGESANPMLGIYTAHALLRTDGFDKTQLGEIVSILRSLLEEHPDVEALAHELGMPTRGNVFDCPPMLASSWSLILAASARQPGLVQPGSLTERVSSHLWGAGPWLLWLSDELASAPAPRALVDVPGMVTQVATTALLGYPSWRAALRDAKLTDIEEALLTRVSRPFEMPASSGALQPYGQQVHIERSQDPDISGNPDTREPAASVSRDLVEALDLPPAAIAPVAAVLVRKLEHAARAGARVRRLMWQLRGPFAGMHLRLRRNGIGRKRTWRGSRQLQIRPVVFGVAAVIWLTSVIAIASTTFRGSPPGFEIAIDDILAATLALSLSLTLGYAVFLWRRSRVHLPFLRRARDKAHRTVGSVTSDVVGRDELCEVIIEDLRDRDSRRPQVIVGGVGTGKTALLAQLTRLLAGQGALPVSVQLRDAGDGLDFRDLAHRRFIADDNAALLSDADGETLWRHLSRHDKIVVLADGLEEALAGEPGAKEEPRAQERDYFIRLALRQAREYRLPLVVTSRPDSSLVAEQAAIVELELLSEETALRWLQDGHPAEAEGRLGWLVTTADVAESPLYLQIARQLEVAGLMPDIKPPRDHRKSDEWVADRAGLRFLLLETWMEALLAGRLATGVPLSRGDRMAVVDQLSVLACLGLEHGTRQVTFDDFEALRNRKPQPALIAEVAETLRNAGRRFNAGLAAVWGTELGLVEAQPNGVRFPDSLIEAYLGSRLIGTAMADEQYRSTALTEPGQEFLIALVMNSRANTRSPVPGKARPDHRAAQSSGFSVADLLREKATTADSVTALYLYSAALQIDCADRSPAHGEIAVEIADRWADLAAEGQRSLDGAKLNLVRRFGEAARTVAGKRQATSGHPGKPGDLQLYRIAVTEPSHLIRMECAQQIGARGDAAFDALRGLLGPPGDPAWPDGKPETRPYRPGHGKDAAGESTDRQLQESELAGREWRESALRAWLAPLLAESVTRSAWDAQKNLTRWLQFVSRRDDSGVRPGLRLSLEVALAQGFKYAANRRSPQPNANPQARAFLLEQAREMLRGTSFWFSRLTLVQALCLLWLGSSPARHSVGGRDADYAALVAHWAAGPGGQPEHPFAAEARNLAVWALETGRPERFMWIDESSVAASIGSQAADPRATRWHNLWIPPSAGWAALHPRAQKLLAEVLLVLNLAEREALGDGGRGLLRTSRPYPPPCLTHDRSPLDPTRTISSAASPPGSHCLNGCPFDLCPYPPQGERARVELSEAFCRRQEALVNWRAPHSTDLRRFWRDMAQRAQP